jgi:cytochrome c553
LGEPSRMDGAIDTFDATFVNRGASLFATTGEGGFNCAGCHGPEGVGGVAPYTVTDEDGEFIANVQWKGPALNTVLLRFSEEEVMDALIYGRPYSPMPAWGEDGGGPLTSQQLEELIAYMWSWQLTPEEAQAQVEEGLRSELGLGEDDTIDYGDAEVGEALFNLGEADGFAGGAYSCARCHTRGWSITGPFEPEDADEALEDGGFTGWPDGAGGIGPNLRDPLIPRQFGNRQELIDFITSGSEFGAQYGRNGMGSGRMPAFGESIDPATDEIREEGMFTEEMVEAVVDYAAGLADEEAEDADEADELGRPAEDPGEDDPALGTGPGTGPTPGPQPAPGTEEETIETDATNGNGTNGNGTVTNGNGTNGNGTDGGGS